MNKDPLTCVVMQPTYLPWSGYFNLIAQADVFVFLDDVPFSKGSKNAWQNKNRILLQGKEHVLTLPTIRSHLGQSLNEVLVDERSKWRKKHLLTLRQAYGPQCRDHLRS